VTRRGHSAHFLQKRASCSARGREERVAAARSAHEYCHMMHDDDFEFETLNTRNSEYTTYFMAMLYAQSHHMDHLIRRRINRSKPQFSKASLDQPSNPCPPFLWSAPCTNPIHSLFERGAGVAATPHYVSPRTVESHSGATAFAWLGLSAYVWSALIRSVLIFAFALINHRCQCKRRHSVPAVKQGQTRRRYNK
jgi:hypothetical protein